MMADQSSAIDRIEAAIRRIEAAGAARAAETQALTRRHADLRSRMAEAVSALDTVIAQGSAEPGSSEPGAGE